MSPTLEAIDRDLMLDTPFLHRIRGEAQADTLHQSILDALALRLDPPVTLYRRIEARIKTVTDLNRLRVLFQAAVRADDIVGFEQVLESDS